MIEVTDEMVQLVYEQIDFVNHGDDGIREGLAAALAIVERDYEPVWPRFKTCRAVGEQGTCSLTDGHAGMHASSFLLYWPTAICRRCASPLAPCDTCGKPSQCGEATCVEHTPDGAP